MRIYAIGDIHGQLGKLKAAHDDIAADRARTGDETAAVIHLGDLVDRGPESRGVIEYLMGGIARSEPWRVLKGNHDRMFADYVRAGRQDPRLFTGLSYVHPGIGGLETLASYGVSRKLLSRDKDIMLQASEAVPEEHVDFIDRLPLFHKAGELLFVHAGIRPGVPLEDQQEDDLLWIRAEFLESRREHGWLVVHGHTPVDVPEHHGNRVALDTGAGFGGPVTAAVFEDGEAFVLDRGIRRPLRPFQPLGL